MAWVAWSLEQYPDVLTALLQGTVDGRKREVLICGMAGARQGWLEAPYLDAPAELGSLLPAPCPRTCRASSIRASRRACASGMWARKT